MSKISSLTQSTLGINDFTPIQRGSSNFRLNVSGAIASYINSNSSDNGAGAAGKLIKYSTDGGITGRTLSVVNGSNYVSFDPTDFPMRMVTTNSDISISVDGGVTQSWNYSNGPSVNTYLSREYLEEYTLPLASRAVSTGIYLYNSSDLTLSDSHNGKTIISDNSTGVVYRVNTGLGDAFSCKVIRNNSGDVSFTGGVGVTLNSFGGSLAIAGIYGVANLNWITSDSYVLDGNLTSGGGVSFTPNTGYAEFTDGTNTIQVPTLA